MKDQDGITKEEQEQKRTNITQIPMEQTTSSITTCIGGQYTIQMCQTGYIRHKTQQHNNTEKQNTSARCHTGRREQKHSEHCDGCSQLLRESAALATLAVCSKTASRKTDADSERFRFSL